MEYWMTIWIPRQFVSFRGRRLAVDIWQLSTSLTHISFSLLHENLATEINLIISRILFPVSGLL